MKEVIISPNSSLTSEINSDIAHKFLEAKGIEHYIYKENFNDEFTTRFFTKHDNKELLEHFFYRIYTKDYGDLVDHESDEVFENAELIFIGEMENIREDKDLISILRLNPNESLKIVEIPDDVKYYVEDYEMGGEGIHECHRSWH